MKANLAVVGENPITNLKVLYRTGHVRLSDETGQAERVGGVLSTIKDGLVYDAVQLREDIKQMVRTQNREPGVASSPGC